MSQEGLVAALEKALFMARNGKIRSFAGVYLLDNKKVAEIIQISADDCPMMIGFTNILLRDIIHSIPVFYFADIEPLDHPDDTGT
jgi:hypothetical protein